MGKHLNLVGTRYGRLLVRERKGKTKQHYFLWECLCDCGNSTIVSTGHLQSGQTKSCGCARRLSDRKAVIEKRFFVVFKVQAKKRKHKFNISFKDFVYLIQQDCFYCGDAPSNVFTYEWTGEKYLYNGLDRIDSSIGYHTENVVPCCKRCNAAKNDMPTDEFISWIKRIYNKFVTN